MKKLRYFLILILFPLTIFSQSNPITAETQISILTVDVAQESHTLYGHTAIRIKNEAQQFDYVWNYGMFDFNTPHFILKFIKGDLQYFAEAYPFQIFEYSYQQENRTIYEQTLHLSLEEKQQLFDKLSRSIFTEEKFYTYKFIDRNCTTKVIDAVNSVLEGQPILNTLHAEESYRSVLYPYQKDQFWMNLGINAIFGKRTDEPAQVLFLPLDLMQVLTNTMYKGKPLASAPVTLFQATTVEKPFNFFNSIYALIALVALFVLPNKKAITIVYISILGSIGLFFAVVGFYSLHREVLWNYNMLLFNPLLLVLAYMLAKQQTARVRKFSGLIFLLLGAYVIYGFNKAHFLMMSPLLIGTAIVLFRLYRKSGAK